MRLTLRIAAALLAASTIVILAQPADASPTAFANCTALHRVYAAGVARPGVTANRVGSGSRPLVGDVRFSAALYAANRSMDRDGDGIACELS